MSIPLLKRFLAPMVLFGLASAMMFYRHQLPLAPPLDNVFAKESSPVLTHLPSDYIYVDLQGEILRPGVYKLRQGDRLFHAIDRSGGFTDDAFTLHLNQAQTLVDGHLYVIPATPTDPPEAVTAPGTHTPSLIRLSTATLEQLISLPGIGAVTAQNIIDYRQEHGPFERIEDIVQVRNIGESLLEGLRDLVLP
jgi:competence protein ComEA